MFDYSTALNAAIAGASVIACYVATRTQVHALLDRVKKLEETSVTREILNLTMDNIKTQIGQVLDRLEDLKQSLRHSGHGD